MADTQTSPVAQSGKAFSVTTLPGFATIAIIVFVALYLPIITLVIYSFNASASPSEWTGFSLDWYRLALQNDQVKDATIISLIVASMSAVISTAVATMAALGTTRQKAFPGQTLIYVRINQPLMVP